ncbi:hypothetical protein OC835_006300 [Tilletia horrida]|nr:hypothetical protein OC835_006300 [Tilletia horrida]
MTTVDKASLLKELPPVILQTLTILKTLPKLEAALDDFLLAGSTTTPRDPAQLEQSARPILLDAGLGKKNAAETIEGWNRRIAQAQAQAQAQTQTGSDAAGAGPGGEEEAAPAEKSTNGDQNAPIATASTTPSQKTKKATPSKSEAEKKSTAASGTKHKVAKEAAPTTALDNDIAELGDYLAGVQITATSQETRFSIDAIEHTSQELDLKLVTISIAERELIVDAHLRIKDGIHYGLVARNGEGKSTLLRAMADNLIPGLPPHLKIQLVSQLEVESLATSNSTDQEDRVLSVIDVVLASDKQRHRLEREMQILSTALETGSEEVVRKAVLNIELLRTKDELDDARRLALRRSGARGAAARQHLIQMEAKMERAKEVLNSTEDLHRDFTAEATESSAAIGLQLTNMDASAAPARARQILRGLGFSEERIDAPYTTLSGGWRSRASLASALTQQANILLLDEPVNYLDLPAVLFLQRFIQDRETAVVTVSHDREFLDNVAEELIVLRKQQLTYFGGNLTQYETTTRRTRKNLLKQQSAMDKKKEHIEKSIAAGIKQAKSSGDDKKMRMVKSRQKKLDDRWGIERSAKGHRFKINRDFAGYSLTARAALVIEELDKPIHFTFPNPAPLRFPGALAHLDHVSFAYPAASGTPSQMVIEDVTLTIGEGERVALVGPNGHGKSTIAALISNSGRAPTKGSMSHHPRARIGLYAQHTIENLTGAEVPPNQTALAHFMAHTAKGAADVAGLPPAGLDEYRARAFLGQLGLHGRTADALPLRMLSGGQKVRLGLAEVFWDAPDLVILDEVTTHLDSDTIDALIDALRAYEGAILLVTHDRHACKRIVEGAKRPRAELEDAQGGGDGSEEESSSEESDGSGGGAGAGAAKKKVGRTYLVENGRLTLLAGGIQDYASRVERKVEREMF